MSIQVKSLRRYDHGVTMGITKSGLCVVSLNGRAKEICSDKLVAERVVDALLIRLAKKQQLADTR